MKLIIFTGVAAFFLLLPGTIAHEIPLQEMEPFKPAAPSAEIGPFEPGEVSRYAVKYLLTNVGSGEIEYLGRKVLDGVPVHHVRSNFSRLGAVDREDIYGSVDDFLPLIVERRINTLGKSRLEKEKYDQENYLIEIDKKKGDTIEKETIVSDERIQNLILLFFHLRQQKLEQGKRIPVNLPKQKFILEVQGLTEVEVPYGSFTAYELRAGDDELRVWISAQENPVVLKATLSNSIFGSYSLVLTGIGRRDA